MTQNNDTPHEKLETEIGVILQDAKRRRDAIKLLSGPSYPKLGEWLIAAFSIVMIVIANYPWSIAVTNKFTYSVLALLVVYVMESQFQIWCLRRRQEALISLLYPEGNISIESITAKTSIGMQH